MGGAASVDGQVHGMSLQEVLNSGILTQGGGLGPSAASALVDPRRAMFHNGGPPGRSAVPLGEVHFGVTCDGCGQDPLRGSRWKCNECANYDLCGRCYTRRGALHDSTVAEDGATHRFARLMSNTSLVLRPRTDGMSSVRRTRYHCHACAIQFSRVRSGADGSESDEEAADVRCPACGEGFVERIDSLAHDDGSGDAAMQSMRSSLLQELRSLESFLNNASAALSRMQEASGGGAGDASALNPVSEKDVSRLPEVIISEEHTKSSTSCAVCVSDWEVGTDKALQLPCGHLFHPPCVKKWFERQNTCPLCRAVVGTGTEGGGSGGSSRAASVSSVVDEPDTRAAAQLRIGGGGGLGEGLGGGGASDNPWGADLSAAALRTLSTAAAAPSRHPRPARRARGADTRGAHGPRIRNPARHRDMLPSAPGGLTMMNREEYMAALGASTLLESDSDDEGTMPTWGAHGARAPLPGEVTRMRPSYEGSHARMARRLEEASYAGGRDARSAAARAHRQRSRRLEDRLGDRLWGGSDTSESTDHLDDSDDSEDSDRPRRDAEMDYHSMSRQYGRRIGELAERASHASAAASAIATVSAGSASSDLTGPSDTSMRPRRSGGPMSTTGVIRPRSRGVAGAAGSPSALVTAAQTHVISADGSVRAARARAAVDRSDGGGDGSGTADDVPTTASSGMLSRALNRVQRGPTPPGMAADGAASPSARRVGSVLSLLGRRNSSRRITPS